MLVDYLISKMYNSSSFYFRSPGWTRTKLFHVVSSFYQCPYQWLLNSIKVELLDELSDLEPIVGEHQLAHPNALLSVLKIKKRVNEIASIPINIKTLLQKRLNCKEKDLAKLKNIFLTVFLDIL